MNDDANGNNVVNNYRINNDKKTTSRSFEYKAKITRRKLINNHTLDTKNVVPLKYLSNTWRSLSFPLINCKIEFALSW